MGEINHGPVAIEAAPVMHTRSRMLSVRLSSQEYEELKRLCFLFGARNLSELARQALHTMLGRQEDSPSENLGIHLSDLGKKVHFLDRKVERLSQMLGDDSLEMMTSHE